MTDTKQSRLTATLLCVTPPDEHQEQGIRAFLQKKYGEDVALTIQQDASLKSGFQLHVGSEVYDWSAKGRMEQFRQQVEQLVAKNTRKDIIPLLRSSIDEFRLLAKSSEVGTVKSIGDGIAVVEGLEHAAYGEILMFDNGIKGMVQDLRRNETGCILFDNGYSKEYDELVGSLKDAGLTPAGLIVSHAHIDHHGNSKRLREAFQIPLAMSLGEAGLIASQAALERYTNYFGRSEEEKISIDTEQRCPVDCIIQPEDTSVTLCGVTFPVHHLPGHSLDHIVIGTPDGVCFAGDALLTENVLRHVKLPYCDHVGLDLESKEAITKLPYQHWILSHKGPFDGNIRELADKNMDLVRLRLAELAKLLQRPMTRDEFYQASRRLIGMHIGTYDQLIRQERHLRPYLEQLVIDGTARLEVKNDTIYFCLNE